MSGRHRYASELTFFDALSASNLCNDGAVHGRVHTVQGKPATGYVVAFVRRTGEARNINFGSHEYAKAQECYNANVGCESTIYTALFIVTDDTGFIERDSYFG